MFDKILVINLMHIGDLLLTTPVLRVLRINFPDSHITLLADKKLADLVKLNPNLDDCLFIDKKGDDNNIPNFVNFIAKVRSRHFDLVINLHRNERASTLAAFSGGNFIIGYAKPIFSLFFDKVFLVALATICTSICIKFSSFPRPMRRRSRRRYICIS